MIRNNMFSVLLTGFILAAPAAVLAETSPPTFISEVRVNNITVDVRVKDAKGMPVEGLTKEVFRIFENGEPQEVTNFLVVHGGQVVDATDEILVGKPADRHLLLFFDLYLMTESDKRMVVRSIRESFEAGMAPGLTVGVVSFDGTLRVHAPPTASRDRVLAALREVERTSATGLVRQNTLRQFDVRAVPGRESMGTFSFRRIQNEEYWLEMRRMVGRVEAAFGASLQRFTEGAGRKLVMLVSPGFPRADNAPMYRESDFFFDGPIEYRNAGLLGKAAFLASELEYTLYTLDPSGAQFANIDADRPGSPTLNDVANVSFWREADRRGSLIQAAELTGGAAMFTADGAAAIADVERVTSSYYSLAFQPDHFGDGNEYTIRVEVAGRPDLELNYRTSYIDRPFEDREAQRTRAALLTGETANPLGIQLVLETPTSRVRLGARGGRIFQVGAEVQIPYASLTMIPQDDEMVGQIQVVVVSVDPRGNQSEMFSQRLPIRLPVDRLDEARSRGYFAYTFGVELEGGENSLRVAVDDLLGGTTSAMVADLKL